MAETHPAATPAARQAPSGVARAAASYYDRLFAMGARDLPWDRTTIAALLTLVAFWGFRVYTTWATWGSLSIDCGREMYVPAMLAQGKTLYRDVWYGYMPAGPYINAWLYRAFGASLTTLYWGGSLAALACAVLVFLLGKRFGSRLMGWSAGAVILLQSFHSWHFCFPLSYSFSSVYGCVAACGFLWMAVEALRPGSRGWMVGAGLGASVAFLIKLEFGFACYVALGMVLLLRALREGTWKALGRDVLLIAPGILLSIGVVGWMLSLGGFAFLTQDNLASTWPSSYFIRTYGKMWMEHTGLALNAAAIGEAAVRLAWTLGVLLEVYLCFWWKRRDLKANLLRAGVLLALLPYVALAVDWKPLNTIGALFFPRDMVFYAVLAGLLGVWFGRKHWREPGFDILLMLFFAGLMGFRILLRSTPGGYAIYYNSAAILAFLLLLRPLIPDWPAEPRARRWMEVACCLGCVGIASYYATERAADRVDLVELRTERGMIRVPSQVANNYVAGIRLMQESQKRGEYVLSLPEDVSLYFLAGTQCPTRLMFFAPGIIAPGRLTDEVIRQMEAKDVRYLLWSNRSYPDYGVPHFGEDFGNEMGDYLKSKYRKVGPLVPHSDLGWQTQFTLWEKKDAASGQQP